MTTKETKVFEYMVLVLKYFPYWNYGSQSTFVVLNFCARVDSTVKQKTYI